MSVTAHIWANLKHLQVDSPPASLLDIATVRTCTASCTNMMN